MVLPSIVDPVVVASLRERPSNFKYLISYLGSPSLGRRLRCSLLAEHGVAVENNTITLHRIRRPNSATMANNVSPIGQPLANYAKTRFSPFGPFKKTLWVDWQELKSLRLIPIRVEFVYISAVWRFFPVFCRKWFRWQLCGPDRAFRITHWEDRGDCFREIWYFFNTEFWMKLFLGWFNFIYCEIIQWYCESK